MPNDDILISITEEPDAILHVLGNYVGSAYSPQVEVTETDTGHTVAITYDDAEDGITTKEFAVNDGQDYVLTDRDRDEIGGIVLDDLSEYVRAMEQATTSANTAEQARATAEAGRATAEQARQSAETGRESADGIRTQAETNRAENERQRASSEQSRATAEQARATAEQRRVTAEQARATAETARAGEWATLKADAVTATSAANAAASSASAAETDLRAAAARGDFDGHSPTVAIASTTDEHTVTITDADGPHSYTVPTYASEEAARAEEWADLKADAEAATEAAQEAATELAPEVKWLWGNQLKNSLSGELMQASDAYGAPMLSLGVDGKSTQDGTPTPDAPVPILSVDDVTLHIAGRNILDPSFLTRCGWTKSGDTYTGTPKQLYQGLTNHILPVVCAANMQYAFAWYQISSTNTSNNNAVEFKFVYSDGTTSPARYSDLNHAFAPISDVGKTVVGLRFSYVSNPTLVVEYVQLVPVSTWKGTAKATYEQYIAPTTVPNILPEGTTLRSLPDGTKDTLALTYLRPSTREGWAWYSRELVQRAYATRFGDITWTRYTNKPNPYFRATLALVKTKSSNDGQTNVMCTSYQRTSGTTLFNNTSIQSLYNVGTWELGSNSRYIAVVDKRYETAADFIAAMGDTIVQYPLATPITTQLDPIELPVLPAPTCTVWADPTTGLQMSYVRDTNLVIANLEAAYADLATS